MGGVSPGDVFAGDVYAGDVSACGVSRVMYVRMVSVLSDGDWGVLEDPLATNWILLGRTITGVPRS